MFNKQKCISAIIKGYVIGMLLLLSGCMINDVKPYPSKQSLQPASGRALVVVGIGAEGSAKNETIYLHFDEYEPKEQRITGGCFLYNAIRANALISDKNQYLVFDVPAGFYTESRYHHRSLKTPNTKNIAFLAPENQVVYFGDFIAVDEKNLERQINFDAATSAIKEMYPEFKKNLVVAETLFISTPNSILCMP